MNNKVIQILRANFKQVVDERSCIAKRATKRIDNLRSKSPHDEQDCEAIAEQFCSSCLYALQSSAYTTNSWVYMRYCVAFIYTNINNFLFYFPFITSASASYFALLMANSFSSCAIRRSLLLSMLTLLV